jgi:hypothetical protein
MSENTEVKISISNTLQVDMDENTMSGVFKTNFLNSKVEDETRNVKSIEWPNSG